MKLSTFGQGRSCFASVLFLAMFAITSPASALDLSGKTVKWAVPFKEGGGSDTIARLMQPYLQEALPGNPTVLILNQPGGGSVTATNKFTRKAKTDGTELLIVSSSTLIGAAMQSDAVRYKATDWRGLVGLPRGTVLYTNPQSSGVMGGGKDPVDDINKLRANPQLHGMKTPSEARIVDLIALDLLGVEVRPVFGLSTSKARKAFMRGETTINSDGTGPFLKLAKNSTGETTPIFAYGQQNADGTVVRDPDLPDVPTAWEVYEKLHGKKLTGAPHDALFGTATVKVALSKSIVLPAGVSDDVYNTYLEAFKKVTANPELQKALLKEVGSMPLSYGKDVDAALAAGMSISDAGMGYIRDLLKTKYDTEL